MIRILVRDIWFNSHLDTSFFTLFNLLLHQYEYSMYQCLTKDNQLIKCPKLSTFKHWRTKCLNFKIRN